MNLLIIDPKEVYFETLKQLLINKKINTLLLHSLDQIHEYTADLILIHDSALPANQLTLTNTFPVPYIVVSSDNSDDSISRFLVEGAADFLALPIKPKESVARINAILNRVKKHNTSRLLTFDDEYLKINLDTHEVHVKDSPIKLTSTEFQILETLATNPQRIFSRVNLMEGIRGLEFSGSDRAIASHVKNLRIKIEEDSKNPRYIMTVHGSGYRFGIK